MSTKMTPQLRFPEFTDEWQVKKLGDLSNTVNGLTYSPSNIRKSGVLVLRSSNIKHGQLDFTDSVFVDENLRYNESKKGDILICVRNGSQSLIGKNTYIDKELPKTTHGAFMSVLRSDESKFIYQLFQTNNYKKQVSADLGARINSINNAQLLKYKFSFPLKPEQEKIADFLTAVDERIAVGEKKLELLETYKRGVMQQIFSRAVRFKDENGSSYPDWEQKKLGEILKEVNEKTEKSNKFETLSSTTKGLFSQKDYFSKNIASDDNTGYKVLRINQIVLSPQNLWMGNINFNDKFEAGIVSPSYKIFETVRAVSGYLRHILKTRRMLYEYTQASEQGASIVRRNLDISSFMAISVTIPTVQEQQKIADFLTTLDEKITAEKSKLTATKQFKKALLQRMFV